jgi:hypothetical protein
MSTLCRGFRAVSLVSLVALVGCGLLGKKPSGDAPDASEPEAAATAEVATAEPAEAAPPPVAAPAAANENDVSRFPDEQKLANVVAGVLRPSNVREIPGIGKVVAALAKGGTVTQIAQRDKFFLVVFEDPKDKKTLMGWIGQEAFTAPAVLDASVPVVKCVLPESALISDSPFCGKICTADTDCPSGQACKGAANKLLGSGGKGDAVTVCTVFGAPRVATVDAAAPASTAVAPTLPIVPVTPIAPAAPAAGEPPASVGIVAPTGGKCPANFSLIKDGQCHRNCVRFGGCPASARLCLNCAGPLVCAANRDICK